MMHDYDRFAALFTDDAVVRIPDADIEQAGRAYIQELGLLRDGRSVLNYALFHDRYRRTPDGWKFTERVYEVRYLDTTALPGSPPPYPVWVAAAPTA